MAKTKQIGVRFDQEMLDMMKEDNIADSPQKALNFLTEFYREHREKIDLKKIFEESKLFNPEITTYPPDPGDQGTVKTGTFSRTNYSFPVLLQMAKDGVENVEAFKKEVSTAPLTPGQKDMVLSKIKQA